MTYLLLRIIFKDFIIFSLNDIRKTEPGFHRQRFFEWIKKGYIKKIIREYYCFSDTEISESILCYIANQIYYPSYISFEFALSYYNLIPEGVYSITSASTLRT